MPEAFGSTSSSSGSVLKSTLLHKPEDQYGLVPKLSHRKWQKHRLYEPKKQASRLRLRFFSGT